MTTQVRSLSRLELGSQVSNTAFLLFVLVNATMILRPAELIKSLSGLPIYECLIVTAVLMTFQRMISQFSWMSLRRQPISLCVVGILVAILLSHLTHGYLQGTLESSTAFLKTLVYYTLFVSVIDSPRRLEKFLQAAAVMSTAMISLCAVDYLGYVDFEFITHIQDHDGISASGDQQVVKRMNGTGIFSDPNDISLLIVAAGVMNFYFLNDKSRGSVRWVWLLPLAVLAVALVCTRSRGGLLAAGVAGTGLVLTRYGKRAAIAIGVLGLCGLTLVAGRQGSFDLSSGTAQERIQLWRDGISELSSANLLFGIGEGLYGDLSGLVAHNSFVHAYVELGLFGGTLFLGCFFFPALALLRLHCWPIQLRHPTLIRFRPYLAALLAGWAAGLMSLSRCYVVPTYMILGIAAAYFNILGPHQIPQRLIVYWDQWHVKRLLASSALMFSALYCFVNVMAR